LAQACNTPGYRWEGLFLCQHRGLGMGSSKRPSSSCADGSAVSEEPQPMPSFLQPTWAHLQRGKVWRGALRPVRASTVESKWPLGQWTAGSTPASVLADTTVTNLDAAAREDEDEVKRPRFKTFASQQRVRHCNQQCLKHVVLFQKCSPEFVEMLAEQVSTQIFDAGTDIVRQGDMGESMYVLNRGQVDILVNGNRVAGLADGSIFGEMAAICRSNIAARRTATVRATTVCDCRVIGREALMTTLCRFKQDEQVIEAESQRRLNDLRARGILPSNDDREWWRVPCRTPAPSQGESVPVSRRSRLLRPGTVSLSPSRASSASRSEGCHSRGRRCSYPPAQHEQHEMADGSRRSSSLAPHPSQAFDVGVLHRKVTIPDFEGQLPSQESCGSPLRKSPALRARMPSRISACRWPSDVASMVSSEGADVDGYVGEAASVSEALEEQPSPFEEIRGDSSSSGCSSPSGSSPASDADGAPRKGTSTGRGHAVDSARWGGASSSKGPALGWVSPTLAQEPTRWPSAWAATPPPGGGGPQEEAADGVWPLPTSAEAPVCQSARPASSSSRHEAAQLRNRSATDTLVQGNAHGTKLSVARSPYVMLAAATAAAAASAERPSDPPLPATPPAAERQRLLKDLRGSPQLPPTLRMSHALGVIRRPRSCRESFSSGANSTELSEHVISAPRSAREHSRPGLRHYWTTKDTALVADRGAARVARGHVVAYKLPMSPYDTNRLMKPTLSSQKRVKATQLSHLDVPQQREQCSRPSLRAGRISH